MRIAIHDAKWGFSPYWIKYCQEQEIPHKVVNCYESDIVEQVRDCDIVLWHHHHTHAKDVLFAKQFLFALQQSGKTVFPDFNSGWHFDDKVGQKYLLESIAAPTPNNYIFYSKTDALDWINEAEFPVVFKLRGGAGSTNVRLVKSASQARDIVAKAFGKGFSAYNRWVDLQENIRKYRLGKAPIRRIFKSIRRFFVSTSFAKTVGRHKGYLYFQEFIPNNTFDIRIITIGDKAFGIKRLTRKSDFRASGSGLVLYNRQDIPEVCVKTAFDVSAKLKASVVAYDFVFDPNGNPLIVEINYGYAREVYLPCPGYWTRDMVWHDGKFNSMEWIIDLLVEQHTRSKGLVG